MSINQRAHDLTEFIYSMYGTDSGYLFGIPPDKKGAVRTIVEGVLRLEEYDNETGREHAKEKRMDEEQKLNEKIAKWRHPRVGFEVDSHDVSSKNGEVAYEYFTESVDSCLAVKPKNWDCRMLFRAGTFGVDLFWWCGRVRRKYTGYGDTEAEALAVALGAAIDGGEKP